MSQEKVYRILVVDHSINKPINISCIKHFIVIVMAKILKADNKLFVSLNDNLTEWALIHGSLKNQRYDRETQSIRYRYLYYLRIEEFLDGTTMQLVLRDMGIVKGRVYHQWLFRRWSGKTHRTYDVVFPSFAMAQKHYESKLKAYIQAGNEIEREAPFSRPLTLCRYTFLENLGITEFHNF